MRHCSRLWSATNNESNNDDDDSNNKKVEDSWDENVDYDKLWKDPSDMDMLPTSAWDDEAPQQSQDGNNNNNDNTMITLGFPNDVLSDLLDAETAAQLKEDAKRIVEAKMQEGLDELAKLKVDLKNDIASQKRAMERSSKARQGREEAKLLQRIDDIAANFLNQSKEQRESTKLAAAADAAVGRKGGGVDLGSWGVLGGADVTLVRSSSSGSGSGIVLGSVENAKQQQQQQLQQQEGNAAVTMPAAQNRILIIADVSSVR